MAASIHVDVRVRRFRSTASLEELPVGSPQRNFLLTQYVTDITVASMTVTFDSSLIEGGVSNPSGKQRLSERDDARSELAAMSAAMVEEKGLLNHAQTALLLGVSVKRVGELVRLGKLRRFDFLGRTYVSVTEVRERYQQELKAGRPKQGLVERTVASVKAALKTDAAQAKLGGYAGP